MRPMFAFLRTMTAPTSVFAAPEDWGDPALNKRVDRAATELVLLMGSGLARAIRERSWHAAGTEDSMDLDTDLMRLAAGGSADS